MDFTTNYCGMYWSDGRVQSSVCGSSKPVNALDAACREHDCAYATSVSSEELTLADNNFYQTVKDLGYRGPLYGSIVKYGNKPPRMVFVFISEFLSHTNPYSVHYTGPAKDVPTMSIAETDNLWRAPTVHPTSDDVCFEPPPTPAMRDGTTSIGHTSEQFVEPTSSTPDQTYLYNYLVKPPTRRKQKKKQITRKLQKNRDNGKEKQNKNSSKTKPKIRTCVDHQYCTRCNRKLHSRKCSCGQAIAKRR